METVLSTVGFSEADANLSEMIVRATTLEATAFPAIAGDFRRMMRQRFDDEGPGWEPLAASTLARKAKKGYPPDILHATGVLRDSLTKTGAAGSVVRITPDELFIGTSDPVARHHQDGTPKMPQRKIVDLGPDESARWGSILQRALGGSSVVSAALDEAVVG